MLCMHFCFYYYTSHLSRALLLVEEKLIDGLLDVYHSVTRKVTQLQRQGSLVC